jgi:hypothetical protein
LRAWGLVQLAFIPNTSAPGEDERIWGNSEKLRVSWMTGCHLKINSNKAVDFVSKTKTTLFVLRGSVYSGMSKSELL